MTQPPAPREPVGRSPDWAALWAEERNAHHANQLKAIIDIVKETDLRYEQRFTAQEKAVNAALVAAKEAVDKAEMAAQRRFESVNEFRQTLSDQARDLMPRLETEQRLSALAKDIATITDRFNTAEGRQSGTDRRQDVHLAFPAIVFGAIGTLVGMAGLIFALVK